VGLSVGAGANVIDDVADSDRDESGGVDTCMDSLLSVEAGGRSWRLLTEYCCPALYAANAMKQNVKTKRRYLGAEERGACWAVTGGLPSSEGTA
jgi:hypothetical protein